MAVKSNSAIFMISKSNCINCTIIPDLQFNYTDYIQKLQNQNKIKKPIETFMLSMVNFSAIPKLKSR